VILELRLLQVVSSMRTFWGLLRLSFASWSVWEGRRSFSGIDSPTSRLQFGENTKRSSKGVSLILLCPSYVCALEGYMSATLGSDGPSQWCQVGRSPGEERSLSFEYLSLTSPFFFGLHPEKPIGPRHASTGRVDRMSSLSVPPWGRKRGFSSFRCLPRVSQSGAFTEETPVAIYHDQCKVLQAVDILSIGCSKCGITRDRSIGPTFLAFFTGLSWSKLWPHGSRPLPGLGVTLGSRLFLTHCALGPCGGEVVASSDPFSQVEERLLSFCGVRELIEVVFVSRVLAGER